MERRYCNNFPVAGTNTPINIMLSDNDNPYAIASYYEKTCMFKSYHPAGVNFVMGDASVHFIEETIDFQLYNLLGTRAGGEIVQVP